MADDRKHPLTADLPGTVDELFARSAKAHDEYFARLTPRMTKESSHSKDRFEGAAPSSVEQENGLRRQGGVDAFYPAQQADAGASVGLPAERELGSEPTSAVPRIGASDLAVLHGFGQLASFGVDLKSLQSRVLEASKPADEFDDLFAGFLVICACGQLIIESAAISTHEAAAEPAPTSRADKALRLLDIIRTVLAEGLARGDDEGTGRLKNQLARIQAELRAA